MASNWMVFSDTDSCPGFGVSTQRNSDFEACKRLAELYNFTGFIHRRGEVHFLKVPADTLLRQKVASRGTTLFVHNLPMATATSVPQAGWQGQQMTPPAPGSPWQQPGAGYAQMPPGQMMPGQMMPPGQMPGQMMPPGHMMPGQMMPGQQMPGQQLSPRQQSQPTMPGQQMALGQQMPPGMLQPGLQPVAQPQMQHMLTAPPAFPALNNAPEDQMGMMVLNTQLLDDWIITLPDVKALMDRIQKTREESSQLAEQILAKESEFTELKTQCEASFGDASAQLTALQALSEQRAEILAQRSPEQVAELFTNLANEAEESAEQALSEALEAPDELDNAALRELRSKYVTDKSEKHAKLAVAEYLRANGA